jgi:DNA invertase Pin-like site-specific DNA recombinase
MTKEKATTMAAINKNLGYVRISTRDQNPDRQIQALIERGIAESNIFIDKQSGKDFNRPRYKQLMRKLKQSDILFVKSIDRLGRNYEEIIEQWRRITKEIGAAIVVLDMPLLDTRQEGRDLTGILIADIVLELLSYVAETERAFNHQRQAEGIAIAQAKGVKFGRPRQERPHNFQDIYVVWANGELSARAAAKALDITHRTFGKWAAERANEQADEHSVRSNG